MGPFCYFLGIEIAYSHKGYLLSQLSILAQTYLSNTHTSNIYIELN